LDLYPPSLNWDEVSHGYNAYSILKTGRDEWGKFMPIIFRAFGDYKLPVYIYLTVPMVKLFGLSVYGVRIVSALAGLGSVVYIYFLIRELLKFRESQTSTIPGIFAALAMAVSPWTVFLSRIAVEANLTAFFIITGAYYFLLGVRQKGEGKGKAWGFALSGLLSGLSLFTYNSARVFVPLLMGLMGWIYRKELFVWNQGGSSKSPLQKGRPAPLLAKEGKVEITATNKSNCACHLVGAAIFLLFFTGMVYQLTSPEGQARFSNISVLDDGTINRINEARGVSELPDPFPRLLYNKGTFLISRSMQGYLSYFNPEFWFFSGGDHYQFGVPGYGLLYLVELPFLIIGLIRLISPIKKNRISNKSRWLILGWILLAPVAAAPTRDNPHALRIVTMMPILYILMGVGFYQVVSKINNQKLNIHIKKKILIGLLITYVLILSWQVRGFWQEYSNNYRMNFAWAWQDGYDEMIEYVKEHYDEYDRIFITKKYGEPHEFVIFYWSWNPVDFMQKKQWDYHADWYWVNGLDKFVFVNDWEIQTELRDKGQDSRVLLVTSPGNVSEGWSRLNTIYNLNNEIVFEIYEGN
jgi:hypothetical protein